ncbi:hypothetical protein V8C86DRAFT_2589513, partial [Haematococcus lacustris]
MKEGRLAGAVRGHLLDQEIPDMKEKLDIPLSALSLDCPQELKPGQILLLRASQDNSASCLQCVTQSGEPVGTLKDISPKLRAHAEVQASLRSLKRNSEGRPCHLLLRVELNNAQPQPLVPALATPNAAPNKQEYIIDDNGFQLRRSQLEQLVTSPEVVLALGDARLQASLSRIDSSGERREQELEAALQGPAFASFAEKVLSLLDQGLLTSSA